MGWNAIRLFPADHDSRGVYEPRAEHRRDGEVVRQGARGARRDGRPRRRLPPPPVGRGGRQLLPEDAVGHARLPRGADPRRDAGGLRGAAQADRRALRDRRGICLEMAVPALHRARHPPVQPHRRLQCRRPDRGDEGRRLERGALCRHDAAQSARADLHRGDDAFRGRGRELRLAGDPRLAGRALPRLRRRRDLPGAAAARRRGLSRCADAPGLGVEVDEALVKEQSFKFWEAPHLRRTDGSVTNW